MSLAADCFTPDGDPGAALAEEFAYCIGMLARRVGATAVAVRWAERAAYTVSLATAAGHVCVLLDTLAQHHGVAGDEVREALAASGVVACDSDFAIAAHPLVLDRAGRLYLARYFDYERRLALALVAHAAVSSPAGPLALPAAYGSAALGERLARYFGPPRADLIDWQRVAAITVLTGSRVTIVSGGPGTGKTTTVAGILAGLLDAEPALRVALAAPTGKAAQRLQEALQSRAGALPPDLAERLPRTALTLHRLLGGGPDGRFRHHRDHPLPYECIVIDEASMIDIALAAHLFDALAPTTRLVLLGDKDQLAAVEAGAVFAELSARSRFSGAARVRIARALNVTVAVFDAACPEPPSERDSGPGGAASDLGAAWREATSAAVDEAAALAPLDVHMPLDDAVIWLEQNYRFGLESSIGQLSQAIRRGAAQDALEILQTNPNGDAQLYDDGGDTLAASTIDRLTEGFTAYFVALRAALMTAEPDPLPLLEALHDFRILCATRVGARGATQVNALIAARVRAAACVPGALGAQGFAGRPVLVTRNDYALGLFNGDTGIMLPAPNGALQVWFRAVDGTARAVSPAVLPAHETAFALTVHKSQGSEFEAVAFVLPAVFGRALSRELIYTAVTRAKASVCVIGARTVLAQAIGMRTQRASGLSARLAEALREQRSRT